MKLPKPRFTVRRLMVAVAIVGVSLGVLSRIWQRSARFKVLSGEYFGKAETWDREAEYLVTRNGPLAKKAISMGTYYDGLGEKYRRAALHPWLPVAPDPPEPK